MFDFRRVPLPDYSRFEDGVNSFTHALGVPFSVAAAVLLFVKAGADITVKETVSILIYTVCMLILFFGSALYHGLKPGYYKQVTRVMDHSNVFFMITGTVTLFYLLFVMPVAKALAVGMLIAVWVATVVGIFLNYLDLDKFKKLQLAMYVILGWTAIVGMVPIWKTGEAGRTLVKTIFSGGIVFTVGAGLYVVGKKHKYIHAVFHVFVLIGAVCVFLGIYNRI